MDVIIYQGSNGIAKILVPADCGLTIEQIQAKDVPSGITSFIVDSSTIPESNEWRDAWVVQDGVIVVDESKKDTIILSKFSPEIAIAREAQVFNEEEMDRFSAVSYMVNELIRFKNFWGGTLPGGISYVGLKQMGEKFVSNGKITRSDYDKLNDILKEQNIDLDNPPAV